jgi:predicted TIM-barrel fold metal-dependent hydrolase
MTQFDAAKLDRIRSGLSHPIIDADGHIVEFMPAVRDEIVAVGGEAAAQEVDGLLGAGRFARMMDPETRRTLGLIRMSWWALPAENSLDRATSMLPSLLYERLPELGIDFAVVYPTLGLMVTALDDRDTRRAVTRGFNRYYADTFRDCGRRMTPAALVPMHTPEEAIEELDYAVNELGLRAAVLAGTVLRPLPGNNESRSARWVDSLGPDEPRAYDAVWQHCLDLGISPTFHSSSMGWGSRTSLTSYVHNHIGNFATAGEATCRSLFLSGVPRRFPDLRFAFLEGGVAWGANLYCDLLGHFEKRGAHAIDSLDPARIDRALVAELFERYGTESYKRNLDALDQALSFLSDPDEDRDVIDEFRHCQLAGPEDIRSVFTDQFYFGCEADDPMNAVGFDTRRLPLGARLQAIFSSDIGHWDVPDMRSVLLEAHEMVEDELMSEDDFRRFTFDNVASLYTATNPAFFEGTEVESAVKDSISVATQGP